MADGAPGTSYDELHYPDFIHRQTHPARLATVAKLHGLDAPSLEGARILELGCSNGANLIPMAEVLPGAELIGLDLARTRIEEGRAVAEALGRHLEEHHQVHVSSKTSTTWGMCRAKTTESAPIARLD